MYKIRGGDLVSSAHPSSITTHCQDSSSNTVVGDHVFANFNANKQSLSTKGLLSQRNNEHMKFSWDPMQVVNISRQQKAVCNRAQQQYQTLDRYFTRQNHLLAYRRSSVIDQLRQRLATLGKLRGRPGTECLLPARREGVDNAAFPIPSTTSSTAYRNDVSLPECTTSTQPEQRNPREPSKSLKYPIHAVSSSQYQGHSDNTGRNNTGRVNVNVNTKTRGYALWDYSVEDTPAKSLHLPSLSGSRQIASQSEIKTCQRKDCTKHLTAFPGFLPLDKQPRTCDIRQATRGNSLDLFNNKCNSLSRRLSGSDSGELNADRGSLGTYFDARSKSVRFMDKTDSCGVSEYQ